MNQEEFYKDQFDRSLDRKNEINNSLSTPIGILSALVAGLLYAASNFEYDTKPALTILFVTIGAISLVLLVISIYHLTKALSDAHQGYNYAYLPDATVLDHFYNSLLTFYSGQTGHTQATAEAHADKEFSQHLKSLMINGADNNQERNKTKMAHRFLCHRYMVFAFISLSLLIIPFGINFGINKGKDKIQQVKIINKPLDVQITDTLDIHIYGKAATTHPGCKTDPTAASNDSRRCRPGTQKTGRR